MGAGRILDSSSIIMLSICIDLCIGMADCMGATAY